MSDLDVYNKEESDLLARAHEIVALFQRAVVLGFSISLTPDQLRIVIAICEEAYLKKGEKDSQEKEP